MSDCSIFSCEYDYSDIPGAESWVRFSEITEGNSSDRKFYVKNNERERFFLRIADCSLYDRKKNEFEYLKMIRGFGMPVPDPVGFGICNKGRSLYLQTRWIYGTPGPQKLADLDLYHQYYLGTDAGLCLKAVHYCQIPPRRNNWATIQRARAEKILKTYHGGRKKIGQDRKLLDFIQQCFPLLDDRPQVLLHGDFTTDNIILSHEYSFSLIDFDNWQYGDPLIDLANVLTHIHQISMPYAIGILDCYFAFDINDEEMRLLAYYAAVDLLERFTAAQIQSEQACEKIIEQARALIKAFHGFKNLDPTWYKRLRVTDKTVLLRSCDE